MQCQMHDLAMMPFPALAPACCLQQLEAPSEGKKRLVEQAATIVCCACKCRPKNLPAKRAAKRLMLSQIRTLMCDRADIV